MCIVSMAWQAHPRWKLIAIGNRDELHARPADALARWDGSGHILAGRDAQAGGTWLGVSEQGRFAVVTNVASRTPPDPERASRGDLLKDFLSGEGQHRDLSRTEFSDFNPFNLITVNRHEALIHSNRPESTTNTLSPGVYGLSNGPLDQPWPKSGRLDKDLQHWLSGDATDPEALMEALLDRTPSATEAASLSTLQSPYEPRHSPIFIENPVYGTRCSTVVAIADDGTGMIAERRYTASGERHGDTGLSFKWSD